MIYITFSLHGLEGHDGVYVIGFLFVYSGLIMGGRHLLVAMMMHNIVWGMVQYNPLNISTSVLSCECFGVGFSGNVCMLD